MNKFIKSNILYAWDRENAMTAELYIDGEKKNVAVDCGIKAAYLCDRRACAVCKAVCGYTTNIEHAENFKREGTIIIDE